jgi:signal transduction histidine kinase/HD-like signal output (HDOD) protein
MNPDTTDEVYLRHCLEAIDSLPTLPAIASEAIQRALSPDTSIEDLAEVIELDPPLTAMVLKVANAPYQDRSCSITSLKTALSKLGHAVVRGIALSCPALELFSDQQVDHGMDLGGLWIHSIETAVRAKELAGRTTPPVDPEEAFVSGLLHDVGKVFLSSLMKDKYGRVESRASEERIPLYRVERDLIGCDHADVGRWLLEHWKIPALYASVIQHHHNPSQGFLDGSYLQTLCRIVDLANQLSHGHRTSQGETPGPDAIPPRILKGLSLSPEEMERAQKEADRTVQRLLERVDWSPVSLATFFPVLTEANIALGGMRQDQEARQRSLVERERELTGINSLGLHLQGCNSLREALRHITTTLVTSLPFQEAVSTLFLDRRWELLSRARKDTDTGHCQTLLLEQSRQAEPYEVKEPGASWLFVDLIGKRGPLGHLRVRADEEDTLPVERMGLLLASCAKLASEAIERIQSHQEIHRLAQNLESSIGQLDEEREKVEQEKLQKENILDSIPLGLLLLNEQGMIRCRNPAAGTMLPPRLLEGKKPFTEAFPDGMLSKAREAVLQGERFSRGETTLSETSEDSARTYQWGLVPVGKESNGEKALLCILQDVTEERILQRQLLEAARMASVGELAAGTAHNLRSPLGAVKGILELLLEELDAGRIACYATDTETARPTRTVKEQLQIVLKSLDKSFSIIDDLLQFARRPDRPPEKLRLQGVLEGAEVLLAELFKERGIRVEKALDAQDLFGRKADLMQVFLNLYSNAYKAMPEGGILTIESRSTVRQPGNIPFIEVVVTDTGYGIPADHIPKIFDPFFTTSDRVEGTGLGLSLTRKMVKEHGGSLEVSSTLGKGTSFLLTLPTYPDGLPGLPEAPV